MYVPGVKVEKSRTLSGHPSHSVGAGVESVGEGVDSLGAGVDSLGEGVDSLGAGVDSLGADVVVRISPGGVHTSTVMKIQVSLFQLAASNANNNARLHLRHSPARCRELNSMFLSSPLMT